MVRVIRPCYIYLGNPLERMIFRKYANYSILWNSIGRKSILNNSYVSTMHVWALQDRFPEVLPVDIHLLQAADSYSACWARDARATARDRIQCL